MVYLTHKASRLPPVNFGKKDSLHAKLPSRALTHFLQSDFALQSVEALANKVHASSPVGKSRSCDDLISRRAKIAVERLISTNDGHTGGRQQHRDMGAAKF